MMADQTLAAWFQRQMRSLGLGREGVAFVVGIPLDVVDRILRGEQVDTDVCVWIASAFDCDLRYVLEMAGIENRKDVEARLAELSPPIRDRVRRMLRYVGRLPRSRQKGFFDALDHLVGVHHEAMKWERVAHLLEEGGGRMPESWPDVREGENARD